MDEFPGKTPMIQLFGEDQIPMHIWKTFTPAIREKILMESAAMALKNATSSYQVAMIIKKVDHDIARPGVERKKDFFYHYCLDPPACKINCRFPDTCRFGDVAKGLGLNGETPPSVFADGNAKRAPVPPERNKLNAFFRQSIRRLWHWFR